MSTTWTRPVDGQGTWRHTAPHPSSFTDLLIAFVVCLLALTLMVGLVVVGRAAMCKAHAHDKTPISYCTPTEGSR